MPRLKLGKINQSNINSTKTIASTLGVVGGIGGGIHGFFEVIQGNQPTNGFIIAAVGKGNNWTKWTNGTEGSFTIIPNFFVTGIAVIIIGLLLAVWSFRFIDTKRGSSIFLIIALGLFLVGGGIAQVPFIFLTTVLASRINKPQGWSKTANVRTMFRVATKQWLGLLIVFVLMLAAAFEISLFGFLPGITDLNTLNLICWSLLVISSGILLVSILGGFVHDSQRETVLLQRTTKDGNH